MTNDKTKNTIFVLTDGTLVSLNELYKNGNTHTHTYTHDVMELGKSKRRPEWTYKMGQEVIFKTKEEKDLCVVIKIH